MNDGNPNTDQPLPKRKPVRLTHFDYSHAGIYFITVCTAQRQLLLSHIVGDGAPDVPHVVLTPIGQTVHTHILKTAAAMGITVDHFMIMPNHVHLLLRVHEDGTSRAPSPTGKSPKTNALIPRFVSTLKRFVHREIGKNIFQRSFHDHIVRDRHDYRKIAAYIENNPLCWHEDCFFSKEHV